MTHPTTPATPDEKRGTSRTATDPAAARDPFLRAANEDDDGYDPYSDRPAAPEPLFERDPWN